MKCVSLHAGRSSRERQFRPGHVPLQIIHEYIPGHIPVLVTVKERKLKIRGLRINNVELNRDGLPGRTGNGERRFGYAIDPESPNL